MNLFKAEGLTAMEAWVIACIVFVFAALMEYTGILLQVFDGAHDDIHGGDHGRVDDIHGGDSNAHGSNGLQWLASNFLCRSQKVSICEQACKPRS